jgi:hypothetical protein
MLLRQLAAIYCDRSMDRVGHGAGPSRLHRKGLAMLLAGSSFKGLVVEADDGRIGAFSDFLFDDQTWKLRWMVVDTGNWLPGRKVLVHPSAIGPADFARGELSVRLTKKQVQDSPDIQQDQPVSHQFQDTLYGYYGWDPMWGGGNYFGGGMGGIGWPLAPMRAQNEGEVLEADRARSRLDETDPHLRSIVAVTGYHLQATDGPIGHIENFMLESDNWGVRYLVADTKNWWPGQHVLLSPYAVKSINWSDREAVLNVSRAQVKGSPPWDPAEIVNRAYEERLHGYYGWPGYGW